MRAEREHRAAHERGQAVAAHAADQHLRAQPRDHQRQGQRGVVGQDGSAQRLQRRDRHGGQQQVLGEGERVRQRVEDGRVPERGRRPGHGVRVPGQHPRDQPPVGTVHHAQADRVGDERPAHEREQRGVAGQRGRRFGSAERRGRAHAAWRVPGQRHHQRAQERGRHQRQDVGGDPPPAYVLRAQGSRGDRLVAAVGPRPAQAEARARTGARERHPQVMGARADRDVRAGAQVLARRVQHARAAQLHFDPSPAGRPQPIGTARRRAQRALPPEGPLADRLQGAQPRAVHHDGSGRQRAQRTERAGGLGRQPRRGTQPHDTRQERQGEGQGDGERAPRSRAPRARAHGGERGQRDRGPEQRERPHVPGRRGLDGRPAQHRQGDQRDQERGPPARGPRQKADHAAGPALSRARRSPGSAGPPRPALGRALRARRAARPASAGPRASPGAAHRCAGWRGA